jgi:hypothetical protein
MITRENFRNMVGLSAEQEDEMEILRGEVIALFEGATKRLWNAREGFIEVITPRGSRPTLIFLNLWPVTSITTVEVREARETDWDEVASTKYKLVGTRRLERVTGTWAREVRVTYDGGVEEADEQIQRALAVQAKFMMARLQDENVAIRSQNFEGGSGVYETANMHPLFKMITKSKVRKA